MELSNGEKAQVVENFEDAILKPKVVGLKTSKIYNLAKDAKEIDIALEHDGVLNSIEIKKISNVSDKFLFC